MPDALGWRCKFGVMAPSTNTIVQPDFDDMRPPGVTNHYSRIFTPNADAVSNETFMAGNERFGKPSRPEFLLKDGELLELVRGAFSVTAYEARLISDPMAMVQRIAARRLS